AGRGGGDGAEAGAGWAAGVRDVVAEGAAVQAAASSAGGITAAAARAARVAWWVMRMLGRKGQRRSGTGPGSPAGRLGSCAACGGVDHHDQAKSCITAMEAHQAE